MKNIHVIPTGKKPIKGDLLLRHLWKDEPNECISWWRYNDTTMYGDTLVYTTLNGSFMDVPSSFKVQNIYITSNEEIKDGDWFVKTHNIRSGVFDEVFKSLSSSSFIGKKIILTTDQDLIKDGVQAIDDEFLEWFVKNPSCEFVRLKDSKIAKDHIWDGTNDGEIIWEKEIIIPKEDPKNGSISECVKVIIDKQLSDIEELKQEVGKVFYESADKVITVKKQELIVEWLLDNLNSEPFSEADFKHNSDMWDKAKEMERDLREKLKDFDTWKKWKNEQES